MDAGRIGQPVVCMDDVKLFRPCDNAGYHRIVVYLIMQIGRITTGKLHASQIIDMHIIEIGIDVVAETIVIVRRHDVAYSALHVIMSNIPPYDGHTVHGNNPCCRAVFIAKRMWQTECNIDIALGMKPLGYTVVGSGQPTEHVRRILPSKH